MVHQGLINHAGLVLDASGSMSGLRSSVVRVTDLQVQQLAQQSQLVDQETRMSVYHFDNGVECLYYDKDVLRLPSIAQTYYKGLGGTTALIDATLKAIKDLQQTATLYGDHAFLLYVMTDGMENASKATASYLRSYMQQLPDNWTIAVFVPNQQGVIYAQSLGFAPGNIKVWTATEQGIQEVARVIQQTTNAYMDMRSTGTRSTGNLFQLGTQNLTQRTVTQTLTKVLRSLYDEYTVQNKEPIASFVARVTGKPYRKGSTFYQLTKPETVQATKQVVVRDRVSGAIYEGMGARQLLNLPDYDVRVAPASHPNYDIFVQSTSTNRNLVPGTEVIVF